MSNASCGLCGNSTLVHRAAVSVSDIASLYKKQLNVDIATMSSNAGASELKLYQCSQCSLLQFLPLWEGTPQLYSELQTFPWYYKAEKQEFEIARRVIRDGDSVLEIGCGRGEFARSLPGSVAYLGLESNSRAVAEAQASGLNVRNQALEEIDKLFSVICVFQVLEHVSRPGEFLSSLVGKLKSGGALILSVPAEDSFMANEFNNIFNMPPHHLTRWPDATLCKLSSLLSLEMVSIDHESLTSEHYSAYCQATAWKWLSPVFSRNKALALLGRRKFAFSIIERILRIVLKPIAIAFRSKIRGHTVTVVLRKSSSA